MASLDRPKLRPLTDQSLHHDGRTYVLLHDPSRVLAEPVLLPSALYNHVIRHFNGKHTLEDIRDRHQRETGTLIDVVELQRIVAELDQSMVLEGPTFSAFYERYQRELVRPPAFAGLSYRGAEHGLRAQLDRLFAHERGAGRPGPPKIDSGGRLRGVLSPHIDYERGGPVYTWAYRALVESSDADTFVILGVAHQRCRRRFVLTRKDFATPLGVVPTDRDYVDRLASLAGEELFDDELVHRAEHSVEFQVVFLQYLFGNRRRFSIVPLLVGSYHDLMRQGVDPIEAPEVRRFVEALRLTEEASGKKVAYVGGIDLCHVGPEFGDPEPVDRGTLERVRSFDGTLLDRAVESDPKGWFETVARVEDRWRVCGLSATYTMLHAMGPTQGRILRYDQAVNPARTCCVTFASLAFDATDDLEVSSRV